MSDAVFADIRSFLLYHESQVHGRPLILTVFVAKLVNWRMPESLDFADFPAFQDGW